jgi:hypothetical protein
VEVVDSYGKEYMKYDHILIGRALVLSKLEEAAKLWITMSKELFKNMDVASTIDKRMVTP